MNKLSQRDAEVVEWQTRRTQNPLLETTCGFKSHLRHQEKPEETAFKVVFLCEASFENSHKSKSLANARDFSVIYVRRPFRRVDRRGLRGSDRFRFQ